MGGGLNMFFTRFFFFQTESANLPQVTGWLRRSAFVAVALSAVLASSTALLMFLLRPFWVALFTSDQRVARLAHTILALVALAQGSLPQALGRLQVGVRARSGPICCHTPRKTVVPLNLSGPPISQLSRCTVSGPFRLQVPMGGGKT